jgi:hypothetical protein
VATRRLLKGALGNPSRYALNGTDPLRQLSRREWKRDLSVPLTL